MNVETAMKKSRCNDGRVLVILRQGGNGVVVSELCREYGIGNATSLFPLRGSFARWNALLGGVASRSIFVWTMARKISVERSDIGPQAVGLD